MKLEACHTDTCLPDYWRGHHLPYLQIPVNKGMTLDEIKSELKSELMNGPIQGSDIPEECTPEMEVMVDAITAAIEELTPYDPTATTFFNELEEKDEEDCDWSVYAYFVFVQID